MGPQVCCVADQEAEVGLEELVSVVWLLPEAIPPAAPAPSMSTTPALAG